jgi:hypothetical protein
MIVNLKQNLQLFLKQETIIESIYNSLGRLWNKDSDTSVVIEGTFWLLKARWIGYSISEICFSNSQFWKLLKIYHQGRS